VSSTLPFNEPLIEKATAYIHQFRRRKIEKIEMIIKLHQNKKKRRKKN
jgi:hypothetical protein